MNTTEVIVKAVLTAVTSLALAFFGFSGTRDLLNPQFRKNLREREKRKQQKKLQEQMEKKAALERVEARIKQAEGIVERRGGRRAPPNTRQVSVASPFDSPVAARAGSTPIGETAETPGLSDLQKRVSAAVKEAKAEALFGPKKDKKQLGRGSETTGVRYNLRPRDKIPEIKRFKPGKATSQDGKNTSDDDDVVFCGIKAEALTYGFIFFIVLFGVLFLTELAANGINTGKVDFSSSFIRSIIIAGFTAFVFIVLSLTETQDRWGYLFMYVLICAFIPVTLQFAIDAILVEAGRK